jgi:hypothetical protein
MKTSIFRGVLCTGVTLGLLSSGLPSQADQQVGAQFKQPISATVNINETGCNNSPGPQITIDGEVSLGGLQIRLILQNNVKGTHQTVVTLATNLVLVPVGTKITIPKQPVLGGVGGNPHISLQFFNKDGDLGDEIYLGRCVQGLQIGHNSLNSSIAALIVSAMGCENHPGPYITFGGGMSVSGLDAKLIFRNNLKGTHTAEWTGKVNLIPDGTVLKIPKQPVKGGSGGNPLVWVQLLQGNGDAIGDPVFLGKCNKL